MKKVDLNDVIIGKNIKKYAKIKNIALQTLADEMGVGYTTMSQWVNGKRPVSAHTLCKISKILRIDICGTRADEQHGNSQYPRTGTEGLQGDTGEAGEADG